LRQYFQAIELLADAGSRIKKDPISLKTLVEMSEKEHKGLQHRLMEFTKEIRLDNVRTELSHIQPYHYMLVKHLTGGASKEAAAIFNVVPKSYRQLDNNEMIGTLRRRLLIKDPDIHEGTKCKCGLPLDPYGWHLQKCQKFSKFTIRTHEEVKDVVSRMMHTAKIDHICELCPFKDRTHESTLRRLDLVLLNARTLFPNTDKGKGLIDVTVVNPVTDVGGWMFDSATDHMRAATKIGQASKRAEDAKRRKYQDLSNANNMEFIPMAFESQGNWGPNTIRVFESLMKRIEEKNNPERVSDNTKSHFWRLQIVFTIFKHTVRHIDDAFSSLNTTNNNTHPLPNYDSIDET